MAMNATLLRDAIVEDVVSSLYGGDLAAVEIEGIEAIIGIITSKVVEHIQANAIVTVASGIAVSTAGTAAAQTGTTTTPGTGTIS